MSNLTEITLAIIVTLVIFGLMVFLTYSTFSYWSLREVINKCNADFGISNWTFTENSDYYSCRTSTITKNRYCYANGHEVDC